MWRTSRRRGDHYLNGLDILVSTFLLYIPNAFPFRLVYKLRTLRWMHGPEDFVAIFTGVTTFVASFYFLVHHLKRSLLCQERSCSQREQLLFGSNFFSYRVDHFSEGYKRFLPEMSPLKEYLVHLHFSLPGFNIIRTLLQKIFTP